MKQNIPTALFAICALFLSFCQHNKSETLNTETGNESIIAWQECVEFSNYDLTVCFINASESRCPCNSQCIWAGTVSYQLKAQGPGLDTTFVLYTPNTPLNEPHSILLGNILLSVDEVAPSTCEGFGDYEHYKVKVALEEQ